MTVEQLIAVLSDYDPSLLVLVRQDRYWWRPIEDIEPGDTFIYLSGRD